MPKKDKLSTRQRINLAVDAIPAASHVNGVATTVITPTIETASTTLSGTTSSLSLSPETIVGLCAGWNYIDGFCGIYTGIQQLYDAKDDYRYNQLRVKGVLNILSGIQLIAVTSACAPLAGASFAVATLCDLLIATIDYCNAARELEFEGWLEERTKEYEYNVTRIHSPELSPQKKLEFTQKNKSLLNAIRSRCRVYCHTDNSEENFTRKNLIDKKCQAVFKHELNSFKQTPKDRDYRRDEQIQLTIKQNYRESKEHLKDRALNFVGMSLLAAAPFLSFCPPLAAATAIIGALLVFRVAITNFFNIGKTAKKIADNHSCQTKNSSRFFKAKKAKSSSMENDSSAVPLLQLSA